MKIIMIFLINFITLYATGPSYAVISLTPIATHEHGEVLFKTYRSINGMGSSGDEGIQVGWLVVSADGVWDERVVLTRDNKINLANPNKVLKALMKKYAFTKDTPLIYEENKVLELKPNQSCYLGNCIDKVLIQKTI